MNRDDIQSRLTQILATIAPEMDPAALDPTLDLREQLDIDSMDLLNFITAIHKQLGVNIPEAHSASRDRLSLSRRHLPRRLTPHHSGARTAI